MIYLASPYSDPDPLVSKARYEAACDRAALMLSEGLLVYSPVVFGHALAERGLPGDWGYWAEHNRAMLERSSSLVVLALPGWQESEGVRAEVAIARSLGLPVRVEAAEGIRSEAS